MEGYQKSNLKGEGLSDLHYGVIVKDITPEYESVKLRVLDVKNEKPESAEFPLPTLEAGEKPVNSRVGFEEPDISAAGMGIESPARQCLPAGCNRRSHRCHGACSVRTSRVRKGH